MTQTIDAPPAQSGNGASLAVQPRLNNGITLRDLLEKRRDTIAAVLPQHMTPERLIKLATVALGRDPKLSRATGSSVVNAVVKAAELGLDCSGTLGSAYLVPFLVSKKDAQGKWFKEMEAQLIIGYRGLIDLARRSGQIASIEARVVWQNDEFDFEYGLEPRLKHKPTLDKEPGELRLVYGIAKLKDGATQIEVMTRAEVDKIKNRSQSAGSDKSPWHTDYPEMARKTVIKRLCKYLPLSVEIQEAIASDNAADPIDAIEGQVVSSSNREVSRTESLLHKITKRPVSEGQDFIPDGAMVDEAASQQDQDDDAAQQPQANDFAVTQPIGQATETPSEPEPEGEHMGQAAARRIMLKEMCEQPWTHFVDGWHKVIADKVDRAAFDKGLSMIRKSSAGAVEENEKAYAKRLAWVEASLEGRVNWDKGLVLPAKQEQA